MEDESIIFSVWHYYRKLLYQVLGGIRNSVKMLYLWDVQLAKRNIMCFHKVWENAYHEKIICLNFRKFCTKIDIFNSFLEELFDNLLYTLKNNKETKEPLV